MLDYHVSCFTVFVLSLVSQSSEVSDFTLSICNPWVHLLICIFMRPVTLIEQLQITTGTHHVSLTVCRCRKSALAFLSSATLQSA